MKTLLLNHPEHVLLAEDELVLALDLDLRAGVLAEQNGVARLDVERPHLAVLEHLAVAYRDDLGAERLLLGSVGDDDASPSLVLLFLPLNQQPILKGSKLHLST